MGRQNALPSFLMQRLVNIWEHAKSSRNVKKINLDEVPFRLMYLYITLFGDKLMSSSEMVQGFVPATAGPPQSKVFKWNCQFSPRACSKYSAMFFRNDPTFCTLNQQKNVFTIKKTNTSKVVQIEIQWVTRGVCLWNWEAYAYSQKYFRALWKATTCTC